MFHEISDFRAGYVGEFESLFGSVISKFGSRQEPGRGPKPKLGASQLLTSLISHGMNGTGIFSEHVFQLFGVSIKDSSLSERAIGSKLFSSARAEGAVDVISTSGNFALLALPQR